MNKTMLLILSIVLHVSANASTNIVVIKLSHSAEHVLVKNLPKECWFIGEYYVPHAVDGNDFITPARGIDFYRFDIEISALHVLASEFQAAMIPPSKKKAQQGKQKKVEPKL